MLEYRTDRTQEQKQKLGKLHFHTPFKKLSLKLTKPKHGIRIDNLTNPVMQSYINQNNLKNFSPQDTPFERNW